MATGEVFFLLFAVLGGVALFIFGMGQMTHGLRNVAGSRLRDILNMTTANRMSGIGLGSFLGLIVHSSGATVMLVGFVNAGLMSLSQAIPVILGANVGTTLSMQAISFRLGEYALFTIAVGFLLNLLAPNPKYKDAGLAVMGFGLLFLGMNIMSDAIRPHRETLEPLLGAISADSYRGLLLGILLATAITAVIQSSGAMIGMCFALIQAGVFVSIEQVFPLVLGAHIGTCATALIGSIGANMEARRTALAHLLFNVFNVLLALVAMRFFLWLIPLTSSDLLRQTANLHTAIMLVAALVALPLTSLTAKGLTRIVRSRQPEPAPSYLDEQLLDYPEQALQACLRELQRVAKICAHSLRLSGETILFVNKPGIIQEIKLNEKVIDEVKLSMKEYLTTLTHRYLSKRQAIMIQHVDRCMVDLERIGDHIDSICDLSLRRRKIPKALVDRDSLDMLFELYSTAQKVFRLIIASLDPENPEFQKTAQQILEARDEYVLRSMNTKAAFTDKVSQRLITPIAGVFFSEYIAALDRIVKHSKSIALAEKQPQFWIKRKKLTRIAAEAPGVPTPDLVDPDDYLDRLQSEEYL